MKKVSFLIPAYNHGDYISATLDSIYDDNYPLKEIVVIDDGSTDNTKAQVEQWIANHSHVELKFRSWSNKGITATLNELIRIASGEYLRLFSSDDLLVPGSTGIMIEHLDDNPEISAVFSDVTVIDSTGRVIADSALKENGAQLRNYQNIENLKKEIISNWAVSGPAILIRKSWYQNNGLYREDMLIDDWDLYLRLASQNALMFCNIKSAKYRIHGSNTCRTPVVRQRLKNLESQLLAARRSLRSFSGGQRRLLRAEMALLRAKVTFLSHRYPSCALHIVVYGIYSLWGQF